MRNLILSGVAVLALAACSTTQLQTAQTDISTGITAACADVMAAVPTAQAAVANGTVKGGAAATTSVIANYATPACGTATAVAALVQNSGTLEWLGTIEGQLAAATPAAATAAPAAAAPATGS